LRRHGEERTAAAGDVLYRVGDERYPFIAIEGEAAILDPQGEEIVRHGPHGFLGELNLLSGRPALAIPRRDHRHPSPLHPDRHRHPLRAHRAPLPFPSAQATAPAAEPHEHPAPTNRR
jgi:hypothetical protein